MDEKYEMEHYCSINLQSSKYFHNIYAHTKYMDLHITHKLTYTTCTYTKYMHAWTNIYYMYLHSAIVLDSLIASGTSRVRKHKTAVAVIIPASSTIRNISSLYLPLVHDRISVS